MFMLVSRYERASLIVTPNKPFSGWGEIFGDEVTASATGLRPEKWGAIHILRTGLWRVLAPLGA